MSSTGYVSFPIADIIEGDEANLTIKWKSHKYHNGKYDLYEKEDIKEDCKWKRTGYEHKSRELKSAATFRAR